MSKREIGIVKWYDDNEGHGYIGRKKGEDVYVHFSAVLCDSGDRVLKEGDPVEFTIYEKDGDLHARNVTILD